MPETPKGRLVIVGDIHGQQTAFLQILRHARLINNLSDWAGGADRLLQVGDVIDRGPHSLLAESLLDRLQEQAPKQGGEVIRLAGNHELEIILGNFAVSELKREQLVPLQQKYLTYASQGRLKASYAYKGFLITHAGVTRKLLLLLYEQLKELSAANLAVLLNFIFRESVSHQFYKHPIFDISTRRSGPSRFGGIFWEDIDDLIASYPAGSPLWQICGHTQVDHITVDKKRHLIAVDAGLHRKLQYVEIFEDGTLKVQTV